MAACDVSEKRCAVSFSFSVNAKEMLEVTGNRRIDCGKSVQLQKFHNQNHLYEKFVKW